MVTTLPPAGVSVALLTPVTPAGAPDLEALDRLVGRAVAAGVAGISPVGSTGEGQRLSRAQRHEVIARVVTAAGGRPVVAGVPCTAIDDTVSELAAARDAGADAALIAPPGYYPISDDETAELFESLADRSPLPLVLYQIPALAHAGFSPAVVARLARHPRIAGIKDSSRDLEYQRTLVRNTAGQPFTVVTGTDALLGDSLAGGTHGAIVASGNVAPHLAVSLYAAAISGDHATARVLQDRLLDLVTACRRAGTPAGWKTAAALIGVCGDRMVPPAHPLSEERRAELRKALLALDLLSADR